MLYVENAAAVIVRSVFSDNMVVRDRRDWDRCLGVDCDAWWNQGMQASSYGVFGGSSGGHGEGATIFVAAYGTLRVDESELTRNGLLARTSIANDQCPPLRGGAIFFQGSDLQVSQSRFQQNVLRHEGYDAQLAGGGQS